MFSEKQSESWGKAIVATLSKELQAEFPGIGGFSAGNLWLMAQFYTEYRAVEFLVPMERESSWSKHVAILKKRKKIKNAVLYFIHKEIISWPIIITELEVHKTYLKVVH